MTLTAVQTLVMIAAVAAGCMLSRFLPFVLFPEHKPVPPLVEQLGKFLPAAMMGLLVVFCFRNLSFTTAPHGLPELIALVVLVLLHLWRRQMLLTIGGATLVYMILVQLVF